MPKQKRYAIIDIETTGGTAQREKITEIAIILHDGRQVIETYETLLNPERSIPLYITQMTGISDTMVRTAPKFYEVAKKIVQMTEGAVFVAHNVRFDYSFVQEEFRRLGFTFSRPQLCTVKLSRAAFPGLASYSLGNLIQHFNIQVSHRHRAMADAMATKELFEKIFLVSQNQETATDFINKGLKSTQLPVGISLEKLHALPETCGVYYLHDTEGGIIYVGKSINIQKRLFEHFADKTEKGDKLQEGVADISYEETGSELIALLLEDMEIKRLKPRINKAQRRTFFPYGIYRFEDEKGYIRFHAVKNVATIRKKHTILQEFSKLNDAKSFLKGLARRFDLCEKLMEPHATEGACFNYHIGLCHGACIGKELADTYNERASAVAERLDNRFEDDFFLVSPGRTGDEQAVVLVENGHFRGYGYLNTEGGGTTEDFYEAVKNYTPTVDSNRIIRQYLQTGKGYKIFKL